MLNIDDKKIIGEGSNSRVYEYAYDSHVCVIKIPHNSKRYISMLFQVEAMKECARRMNAIPFLLPEVICYDSDERYGEYIIMDKLRNIYPISMIMQNGLIDREFITIAFADAVAYLHGLGISGYDVEFYWSYDKNQLALLDMGPLYTVGFSEMEMVEHQYKLAHEKNNKMAIWNLVSELLDRDEAMHLYDGIMSDHEYPLLDKLKTAIPDNGDCLHIKGVAQNHYLQLLGDCPFYLKEKLVKKFENRYISKCPASNVTYLSAFSSAYKNRIYSSTTFLYASKFNTLSKMSNSVKIKVNE